MILKSPWNLETPFLIFVYISSTRTPLLTSYLHRCWATARGTSKHLPPGDACRLTFVFIITSLSNFLKCSSFYYFSSSLSLTIAMNPLLSLDCSSTESDVFYQERSSEKSNPIRNNTKVVLNSTKLSGAMKKETIRISSVASPEPRTVTIDSDSNEPTIPYVFVQSSSHCATQPHLSQLTAHPFQCVGHYGRDSSGWTIQPPITGAIHPVSNFDATNECGYQWRLGDNAQNNGRRHILYWRRAQTSLFGNFSKRHLWLQWAKKRIYCFEPFLQTAASTQKKRKESWALGCLFPKRGECRSTTARHAANPQQPKRHPDAQEKLKRYILLNRV